MDKKLMIIGLCGRSGSGKGHVSRLFQKYGIPSIDTDAVYREITSASDVLSDCMKALIDRFGSEAALLDNSLNRTYIRSLVFGEDKAALADLNSITHGFILDETLKRAESLSNEGFPVVIVDAPVLFESGFNKLCDFIICVAANDEISVERITARDGITRKDALKRLAGQAQIDLLISGSDLVITNDGASNVEAEVENCVKIIKERYLKKFSHPEN